VGHWPLARRREVKVSLVTASRVTLGIPSSQTGVKVRFPTVRDSFRPPLRFPPLIDQLTKL